MKNLQSRLTAILFFAFWAVLLACGGSGGSSAPESAINYTTSGHGSNPGLNGTHTFTDGQGVRAVAAETTYEFRYNFDGNANHRVYLFLRLPTGTSLAAGQTYSFANTGPGWLMATAFSLTNNANGSFLTYGNSGTMTITSVSNNSDGSQTVGYSFSSTTSGAGAPSRGTLDNIVTSGSGSCRFVMAS